MKKWFVLFTIMPLLLLTACSNESSSANNENEKLKVTTTIAQIADGVNNIGGEMVEVQSLMGPGTDPHLYKATQSDIAKLQDADVIFYNGLNLEGKMHDILDKMNDQKPTYAISESIKEEDLLDDEDDKNAVDPHVWFDIDLWKHALEEVKSGLIEADPANKEYYEKNAEEYFKKLDDLKVYASEQLKTIPEDQRVLVTAHDAFGYFGAAYEMEVLGLQGLSTDAEFGLGDVQHLVDTLVNREIKAVFVESSISERSINAVIEGAQQKGHEVGVGGELYSDAMGEEGTEEGTYIGMYKHNIDTVTKALK